MKTTVASIARDAGVSIGKVARISNDEPSVSEELCRRVYSVAGKLDYRTLRCRSKPISNSSCLSGKNIALVLLGMDRSLETLPVIASAIHGAETASVIRRHILLMG